MIKTLRIDERLIHGQVAVTWCAALDIDSIVVANDEAAANEITVMSLKMAAPQNVKVAVKSIKEAVQILLDPRAKRLSILILVKKPEDALELIRQVNEIPHINVGNFGLLTEKDADDRKRLSTSFAANEQEIKLFKEIVNLRPDSFYQMTPTLQPIKLKDLV